MARELFPYSETLLENSNTEYFILYRGSPDSMVFVLPGTHTIEKTILKSRLMTFEFSNQSEINHGPCNVKEFCGRKSDIRV